MGAGHEPARCQPPAKGRDPSRVPPEHTASNALYEPWCYNAHMAGVVTAKVSNEDKRAFPLSSGTDGASPTAATWRSSISVMRH